METLQLRIFSKLVFPAPEAPIIAHNSPDFAIPERFFKIGLFITLINCNILEREQEGGRGGERGGGGGGVMEGKVK